MINDLSLRSAFLRSHSGVACVSCRRRAAPPANCGGGTSGGDGGGDTRDGGGAIAVVDTSLSSFHPWERTTVAPALNGGGSAMTSRNREVKRGAVRRDDCRSFVRGLETLKSLFLLLCSCDHHSGERVRGREKGGLRAYVSLSPSYLRAY